MSKLPIPTSLEPPRDVYNKTWAVEVEWNQAPQPNNTFYYYSKHNAVSSVNLAWENERIKGYRIFTWVMGKWVER